MIINRADQYRILHYVNGDREKLVQISGATSLENLRNIMGDTPAIYKVGTDSDMESTNKELTININDFGIICAYAGENKIYTPSVYDFTYYQKENEYHGQEDRTTARWFNWSPYLDQKNTIGTQQIKYIGNLGEYKRVCLSLNERNIELIKDLTHNGEQLLQFGSSNNRDVNIRAIDDDGLIREVYKNHKLYNPDTEEEKPYFYFSTGVSTAYGNFDISFNSSSGSFFGAVDGTLADTNNGLLNIKGHIDCNVWVFMTDGDADEYLRTGDSSKAINKKSTPEEEAKVKYFYYDYTECTVNPRTHEIDNRGERKLANFRLINDDDNVAFVKMQNQINRYQLECTNANVLTPDESGAYSVLTPFENIFIRVYKEAGGVNLYGDIKTNIKFVDKLEDANYNDDEIPEDSYNGIDATMDLTNISTTGGFIHPYYMTVDDMNNLSRIIFANDQDVVTSLKEGLWMYSGNPIDCIVDVCLYPIDLSVFVDSAREIPLKFGNYTYNGELSSVSKVNYNSIRGTNKTYDLVNQRILPIYGDFRDISNISLQLFLPYYGLIPLDNVVIGKTLKVSAKLDIYTSQLKYYLFIDGALFSAFECTIGRHMTVIGSDWLSKSSKNISSSVQMTSGLGNIIAGGISGEAQGIVGGVAQTLTGFMDYERRPATQSAGSSTSGLNLYDPMSCFLIIEQYETIKPANLNKEYGIPCYKIAKIGTCKGFTEITDVKLKTRALKTEIDEILSILRNGVII